MANPESDKPNHVDVLNVPDEHDSKPRVRADETRTRTVQDRTLETVVGLWGTSNSKRVAVTQYANDPNRIIGYITEVRQGIWSAEGDPADNLFLTPRQAADFAFTNLWN